MILTENVAQLFGNFRFLSTAFLECPEGKKSKSQCIAQFGNLALLKSLCIFVSKKMARIGEGRFEAKDRARWRSLEAEK